MNTQPEGGHGGDGTTSQQLRDVESSTVSTRRGILWKGGLAAVAGAGVLTALDTQRADAANGGNFILGQSNSATSPTVLTPGSGASMPLFQVNGATMGATQTVMEVDGPSGGAALVVSGASTATTVGLAVRANGQGTATGTFSSSSSGTGLVGSSSTGTGVSGQSSSGVGVLGSSGSNDAIQGNTSANGKTGVAGNDTSATGGTGVFGTSAHGVAVRAASSSGTALFVAGKTHFSRSGSAKVGAGKSSVKVNVPGLTANNLVLATLQKSVRGVYIEGAVPAAGHFTVKLSKTTGTAIKVAWMVIN
jgi:hypothetical protein